MGYGEVGHLTPLRWIPAQVLWTDSGLVNSILEKVAEERTLPEWD